MNYPWLQNTRLKTKTHTIGTSFKHVTQSMIDWIQAEYAKGKMSQKELAMKASSKYRVPITVGTVQKIVNITDSIEGQP